MLQSFFLLSFIFIANFFVYTKSSGMLNKNTLGIKKCEANQKQVVAQRAPKTHSGWHLGMVAQISSILGLLILRVNNSLSGCVAALLLGLTTHYCES